jgi:hypothetical protein
MEILIQYAEKPDELLVKNQSIRDLRIFALYNRKFLANTNSFRHYVAVIGYSGGACQEEYSYVIHGSELSNSKITFTPSSYPTYWEQEYFDNEIIEASIDLDEMDTEVFNEFQVAMSQYLVFSEKEDCYMINLENEALKNGSFYATPKFPIKILEELNSIYWPFSTNW